MNAARLLERSVAYGLVVVHVGLLGWALVGFAEWFLPEVPWRRVSNPRFSAAMLLSQWGLITLAATIFLFGFSRRWPHTPISMALVYSAMALVCAYQTFFILTHSGRFRAMAIEYVEYALVLAFLFLSPYMRARWAGAR
jgi:hypothetical protein